LISVGCVAGSQVVDGGWIETPNNTAVISGQSVVLRCRSDSGVSEWYHTPIGGRIYRIAVGHVSRFGCTVQNQFSSVYSVVTDGVQRPKCDLVINNTDSSLTGLYTCLSYDGHATAANVTAIGQ